jgi:hypothetical protein
MKGAVSDQQRKSNGGQIAPRLVYPVYWVGGANFMRVGRFPAILIFC